MGKVFGKENDNNQSNYHLTAVSAEIAQVRENLAKLKDFVEHVPEDPPISEEIAAAGVYSPQQQADSVLHAETAVVLPLTPPQINQGLHQQVFQATRWLAEWCLRMGALAKKKGLAVVLGETPTEDRSVVNQASSQRE